jgi:predicted aconitase with swiveling domain
MIKGRILHHGEARGSVTLLTEPLSFWGGFDPKTGAIIDVHHPQCGTVLTNTIALMFETRGSGTAPGAIAEAIRLGTAPAAIITVSPDVNIAVGAAVAEALYGRACPILAVEPGEFEFLAGRQYLQVFPTGMIMAASP